MRRLDVHRSGLLGATLLLGVALTPVMVAAEPINVRYTEGSVHGFVTLRTLDDKVLADGDVIQTVRGDRVTTKLVFNFKDGSLHEQTTIYSQKQRFQLISDKLVQKGPAFPQPLEMTIDAGAKQVTVRYQERGQPRTDTSQLEMPTDLSNGLVSKMLMNARPDAMPQSFSFIAATPQPRLVKLLISNAGRESFSIGGTSRQATHYVMKVEIGGLAGVLAPIFGKQPPDSHVWIAGGEVPAFVRAEQPLYAGGPVWRIDLAGPSWPGNAPNDKVAATKSQRLRAALP